LHSPNGVAVDTIGNIYIADTNNSRIRIVYTNETINTIAGNGTRGFGGDGGYATSASLHYPYGVALDTIGNVYIADNANHRIRIVYPSGTIDTVAGDGIQGFGVDGGAATSESLNHPSGVAVDTIGNVYIADTWNSEIQIIHKL
jgi:sugar lactone lactonase YvrE